MLTPGDLAFVVIGSIILMFVFIFIFWIIIKNKKRRLKNGYKEEEDKSRGGEIRRGGEGFFKEGNLSIPRHNKPAAPSRSDELPTLTKAPRKELALEDNSRLSAPLSKPRKRKKRNLKRFG